MTVEKSVFSERLFEFLFNAEFMHKNAAQVIGTPHIPSQDEEKWLGYDVAFDIQNGPGVFNVLALQHKVVRLVDGPGSASNIQFRTIAGNTYFAFPVDPFQFNTIEALASGNLPWLEFYFCAPLFVDKINLDARYAAQDLDAHSVYIDVTGAGQLDESIAHSIIYTPTGNQAWVFSETPRALNALNVKNHTEAQTKQQARLTLESVRHLYSLAFKVISDEYARRTEVELKLNLPDNVANIGEFNRLRQQLQRAAPEQVNFESEGEGWLEIGRLFALYLDATTIVEKCPK